MADINVSGALTPTTANTPLDKRSRISTLSEITSISYPFVGMVVFVEDTQKRYLVTELDSKTVGSIVIPNAVVKTYKELADDVADEIEALQSKVTALETKVSQMEGDDPEDDPTVADTLPEMQKVLAGINPETDNVKDMIDEAKTEDLTEEQMDELTDLFPTA